MSPLKIRFLTKMEIFNGKNETAIIICVAFIGNLSHRHIIEILKVTISTILSI